MLARPGGAVAGHGGNLDAPLSVASALVVRTGRDGHDKHVIRPGIAARASCDGGAGGGRRGACTRVLGR